jgi:hypothetical protein
MLIPSLLHVTAQALKKVRRALLPTAPELEAAYLDGATDLNELEFRIRRLDRRKPFETHHYGMFLAGR